jgi:hypothetical protein
MTKTVDDKDTLIADEGLVAQFLKMTPEERLKANDHAINAISELRNAYKEQNAGSELNRNH